MTRVNIVYIYNYLGFPEIAGSDFQQTARDQVTGFGARLVDEEVTAVTARDQFLVTTASGESESDYLILTEGISAGAGAVAALDILAREEGKDVQDWETPPKD